MSYVYHNINIHTYAGHDQPCAGHIEVNNNAIIDLVNTPTAEVCVVRGSVPLSHMPIAYRKHFVTMTLGIRARVGSVEHLASVYSNWQGPAEVYNPNTIVGLLNRSMAAACSVALLPTVDVPVISISSVTNKYTITTTPAFDAAWSIAGNVDAYNLLLSGWETEIVDSYADYGKYRIVGTPGEQVFSTAAALFFNVELVIATDMPIIPEFNSSPQSYGIKVLTDYSLAGVNPSAQLSIQPTHDRWISFERAEIVKSINVYCYVRDRFGDLEPLIMRKNTYFNLKLAVRTTAN